MCRPLYGTTAIIARRRGNGMVEIRMGFDFPPTTDYWGDNPFDPDYYGNFIRGIGTTIGAAMNMLQREAEALAEIYWL
jgi:hypothetical protein